MCSARIRGGSAGGTRKSKSDSECRHRPQAASDAAKALGTPGAADDILAQMSGSRPGTPEPAAVAAALAGDAAKDTPAEGAATAEPAAGATEAAEPEQAAAPVAKNAAPSAGTANDLAPEAAKGDEPAPAAAVAAADSDSQPAAGPANPAEASTPEAEAVEAPKAAAIEAPTAAAAAATSPAAGEPTDQVKQELGSPAVPSTAASPAAPATPEATPTANGASVRHHIRNMVSQLA